MNPTLLRSNPPLLHQTREKEKKLIGKKKDGTAKNIGRQSNMQDHSCMIITEPVLISAPLCIRCWEKLKNGTKSEEVSDY
jgi:hypothetical protein